MNEPFNIEDFQIDRDRFWKTQPRTNSQKKGEKILRRKLQFYKFPVQILESLVLKCGPLYFRNCLIVLMVLYEAWYLDPQHRYKIKLTSADLTQYGISKDQKSRALAMLVKANVITVDRTRGKNPWVTCHWLAPPSQ